MKISKDTRKALKYLCNLVERGEPTWTTSKFRTALEKVSRSFRKDEQAQPATDGGAA